MSEEEEISTCHPASDGRREADAHGGRSIASAWSIWVRRRRIIAAAAAGIAVIVVGIAGYRYNTLARRVDARLATGPFSDAINIFGAPPIVAVGDPLTREDAVALLRHAGYSTARGNPIGSYNLRPDCLEIFPARNNPGEDEWVLYLAESKISRIVSQADNTDRPEHTFPPQLVTNLSELRDHRRMVRFADIPASLVGAVLSTEDKHFFHHSGFDLFRILKAAYVDVKEGRKEQGASTLTMQLARNVWLAPDKRWKRKLEELLITVHLEQKLSKQQIFEDYCNEVYLGRRGPFNIKGFGEGARTYFGKDLSQLTEAEAALLAGLVQRPSFYNPYLYPGRALERRNVVLGLMRQNLYLSDPQYRAALQAPVKLAPAQSDEMEAQYFLDFMDDELQSRLDDHEQQARAVYTTLDPELQQAAQQAVREGMELVDRRLRARAGHEAIPRGQPQVALVALDPRTGAIKALVGGRNYGTSQLNHALASRQPGSVFKPFVYAAALDTAVQGGNQIFTAASLLNDQPTTFLFGNRVYQPDNFGHEYMGDVTLRTALAHSLNVATVQLAEEVGYGRVASMARRAGLDGVHPTPSLALGAYEATPVDIAGAYTIFANRGVRLAPWAISKVRGPSGAPLYEGGPEPTPALDPRVAYLMVSMMQEVLRSGTGAGVRARGFTLPAAGKTGTSRDGWFAGFTSELLCVVWVGFDDNRDLNLEGAHSALPIWTEFMKRAARMRAYRDARPFQPPAGVVAVDLCADSGQLATSYCPRTRFDVFIDGTEPVVDCEIHSPNRPNVSERTIVSPETAAPER
jgi:penicillin-binding protein 1B